MEEKTWYGYDMNPYYYPENCGLELICSYDINNEPYQFNLVAVWRDVKTGKFYKGQDSGCSCPTPFEDFHSLSDMAEISRHEAKVILGRCK
jgi:hypothetical protein